jgi:hypothetical protein
VPVGATPWLGLQRAPNFTQLPACCLVNLTALVCTHLWATVSVAFTQPDPIAPCSSCFPFQAAHPDQAYFAYFYTDNQPKALYFDSKQSSHPLSMDEARMNSTNTIESVFDAVMYQKGGELKVVVCQFENHLDWAALRRCKPGSSVTGQQLELASGRVPAYGIC